MLHSRQITIPANTTEANRIKKQITVNRDVVYRVWVGFPPGCAGLVKLRIFHQSHAFVPVEEDQYLRGDGFTYVIPTMYEIKSLPSTITIEVWNDDDTYLHTVDVQLLIINKMWIMPVGAYEGILAALASIFRKK